jgi:hypothetical protein
LQSDKVGTDAAKEAAVMKTTGLASAAIFTLGILLSTGSLHCDRGIAGTGVQTHSLAMDAETVV